MKLNKNMTTENIIKKNAQEWIEKTYPKLIQKNLKKLDISNQNLEGSLDLNYFAKLEELNCSNNSLTALVLFGCPKLKKLEADKGVAVYALKSTKDLLLNNLKKEASNKKKRYACLVPQNTLVWNNLHPDFTLELTKSWQDLGFSKEQTQEWINVGFTPQDYEICVWLRDVAKKDAEWILNNATRQGVERNFLLWKQEQLQAHIEIYLKVK